MNFKIVLRNTSVNKDMIKFPLPTSKPQSKIKKEYHSYGNKGMDLENRINKSNLFYVQNNLALFYKRPTPIRIVKVDYQKSIITKAYFEKQSTTDYNGVYKGCYFDFEAKSTNENSFPLANIKSHQIAHLNKVLNHNGKAFFIIEFVKHNIVYMLPFENFLSFTKNEQRHSIPKEYFEKNAYKIKEGLNPPLDFLLVLDDYYFSNKQKSISAHFEQ